MILHGPYSGVNSTVENTLFDGDTMQFLQDYEVVGHIIFTVLEKSPSFLIYDEEPNQRFNGCGGVCFFLRTVIGAYARELHPAKKHQGIFTMENNASDSPHHCASIAKVQYDSQGDAVLKTTPKLVEILSASQLKTYREIQVSKFGAGTPKVFNLYQTPSQDCILDLPCHEMSSSELLLQSVNDRKQHEHDDGHANVRNKNRLFPRDTKQVFETRSIIEECPIQGPCSSVCISIYHILENVVNLTVGSQIGSYSQVLEKASASSVFIFLSPHGKFQLGCRCCNKPLHNSQSGDFSTIHEAFSAVPYSATVHRLVKPMQSHLSQNNNQADKKMQSNQGSSCCDDLDQFSYHLLKEHFDTV